MNRNATATDRLWHRVSGLARILEYIGAAVLFAMMALTFADVIGRYVFSRSIVGAFEVTEFMLATSIFIGVPLITLRGGHITVDLLDHMFADRVKRVRDRLVHALWAVVFGYLGWQLWIKAADLVDIGEITQVLRVPIGPAAYLMGALVLLSALLSLTMVFIGAPPPSPNSSPNEVESN